MAILHVRKQGARWRWIVGFAAVGVTLIVSFLMLTPAPAVHEPGAQATPTAQPVAAPPVRAIDAVMPHASAAKALTASNALSRLDFDSADDLYALATAAVNSSDAMTLHNGWHAAFSCRLTPQSRAQYEALIADSAGDAVAQERKRAAGVVLRKCAGFFNNDASANADL